MSQNYLLNGWWTNECKQLNLLFSNQHLKNQNGPKLLNFFTLSQGNLKEEKLSIYFENEQKLRLIENWFEVKKYNF